MLRMCKLAWLPIVLAMLVVASQPAVAQEPVVVISTKSADGLISDAKYVLGAGGQPELGNLIDGMIDQFTQGKGLQGIERTKPLGAYMSIAAAGTPDFVVFIPVNDIKAFRDLLATYLPQQQEVAGGTFSLQGQDQQIYGKYQNGYCYLTLLPAALSKLPDPAKFVTNKTYALSLEADIGKLPNEVKEQLLETIENAVAAPDEGAPPADDVQARIQARAQKMTLQMFRMLVKETDRLSLGIEVDQKSKVLAVDVNVRARTGTPLAQSLAGYAKTTGAFAALGGPEAAMNFSFAAPVADELRDLMRDAFRAGFDQARAGIDSSEKLQTPEQKKVAKDLIDRVTKVIEATGDTGKIDAAVVMNTVSADKVQVVAAAKIAKGDELAKVIDDFVKQNPNDPGLKKLKRDVAKHGGARIHELAVELEGDAKQNLGDGPIHLAIRDDAVYFAIGGDSLAAVKAAIDNTGKPAANRPPISIRMRPSKLIAVFAKDEDEQTKLARESFKGDGDHISLELLPAERGARLRLEFGEGFLRFIGALAGQQLGG